MLWSSKQYWIFVEQHPHVAVSLHCRLQSIKAGLNTSFKTKWQTHQQTLWQWHDVCSLTWCVTWLAVKSHIMSQMSVYKHSVSPAMKQTRPIKKDQLACVQLFCDRGERNNENNVSLNISFLLYFNLVIECPINSRERIIMKLRVPRQ